MGGILFSPPQPSYHPQNHAGELLWVPRSPSGLVETGIPCFLIQQPRATRLVIYFHANAEDLGTIYRFLKRFGNLSCLHVLAVEYPGYGICSGVAGEDTVLADAEAVFQFVYTRLEVPTNRMIVMGRSLGCAPAIHLASKFPCAGLVTLSAFCSVGSVVASYLIWQGWYASVFDNIAKIRNVRCPTIIVHGSEDNIVDIRQAHELVAACGKDVGRPQKVCLSVRQGLGHGGFDIQMDIVRPIFDYFDDIAQGDPLVLREASSWLRLGAVTSLASDVASRVPYPSTWPPVLTRSRSIGEHPRVSTAAVPPIVAEPTAAYLPRESGPSQLRSPSGSASFRGRSNTARLGATSPPGILTQRTQSVMTYQEYAALADDDPRSEQPPRIAPWTPRSNPTTWTSTTKK
eukprot:TRINITY_DN43655_c0_g1_i1.p1 TRINITY_DN43655_c0_g1~~TRINITY_DN43655_c0_g1_i1.p1  ORF type:complete len:402 (+),score=35.49 TRINITY_DN43655_c0_g1_i1:230-1435(+)